MRKIHEIDPRQPLNDKERTALVSHLDSLEKETGQKHVYVIELHPTYGQHTRAYSSNYVEKRLKDSPKAVPLIIDVIERDVIGNPQSDYRSKGTNPDALGIVF